MKMSTIIIILLIISLLFFIAIGALIYLNRGGEQMVSITIKSLLIPVLAGAGLLLIEFTKPLNNFNDKLHIGFVDDPKIMSILNNRTDGELNKGIMQYWMLLSKVKEENSETKLKYDDVKNFIQVFIIDVLANRNSTHWDIDYDNEDWFFESGSTVISTKLDAEKNPENLSIGQLQNETDTNPFLTKMDSNRKIYLPKNSKLTLGDGLHNLMEIETDNVTIKISITNMSTAHLPHSAGETADKFRKKLGLPLDESYLINFYGSTLNYKIEPKRIKRWSPKTLKEIKWGEDTFNHIQKLISWEKFKSNSE